MTGYLRFILAVAVMIAHAGIRFYGLNPGVIAVVIFYLLAGSVVSHLLTDIITDEKGKISRFYLDRVLRIFPLYLYVASLTVLFLTATSFGNPQVSFVKALSNLLIIPLNYFMFFDSTILTNPSWCLVPPAWSLGAELQAYILLPYALRNKHVKILLIVASFCVYILANLSIIQPDYYGYRLIFGTFFIFIIGSSIHKNSSLKSDSIDLVDKFLPMTTWCVVLSCAIFFHARNLYSPAYTKETFIGLLLGVPLVHLATRIKKKLPLNTLLGSLSYGVFLSHFLIIWLLEFLKIGDGNRIWYIVLLSLLSITVAYSGVFLVERKVNKIRFK